MKANYKNWVPKGMIVGFICGAVAAAIVLALVLFTELLTGTAKTVVAVLAGLAFVGLTGMSCFFIHLYNTFSYDGKVQFARRIIDKVSDYVVLPDGGVGLDVGCGSAALTIACAKKNPQGTMVGLDRWGKEYASFSRTLCENNAAAEGVSGQVSFVQGDACHLDFPDEHFDAITSNFCYHNIPSGDRKQLILESLRTLKKGGVFAIHDEFSKSKYGDVQLLVQKLRDMGYEKVEFLDTTDGLFMTPKEAASLALKGSGLLVGKK